MKVLYLKNNSIHSEEVLNALRKTTKQMEVIQIPDSDAEALVGFAGDFGKALAGSMESLKPDAVFSIEYYPSISELCMKLSIAYVSWVLSCKLENIYSATLINDCNYIYIPDAETANNFRQNGVKTVHYMPYGVSEVSGRRVDIAYAYHISWIGSLFPRNQVDEFATARLRDSTRGYVDGMCAMQRQVYGYDFFERLLPKYVTDDLAENCPMKLSGDNVMEARDYYTERFFHNRVNEVERRILIEVVSKIEKVDIFTDFTEFEYENVINHGSADYQHLSSIIRDSKVNLNITSRSMRSGISPHAFRILGQGGFLVTDYRAEYYDWFVPGDDLIVCESSAEFVEKIKYYLSHDEERIRIAENGHRKAAKQHCLYDRIVVMFNMSKTQ